LGTSDEVLFGQIRLLLTFGRRQGDRDVIFSDHVCIQILVDIGTSYGT
jgi:hypothetical protein